MLLTKSLIGHVVNPVILGRLDYYRFPERRKAWGGPFNGQARRVELFENIMRAIQPKFIVETGTYRGNTTELFAKTGLPVFTIEGSPRIHGFARQRLRGYRNVVLMQGDSRERLRSLLHGSLRDSTGEPAFFYLDAHWNADLPLEEEVRIVFTQVPAAIVMIDDFEVPGDAGYGFDDFGPGKTLNAHYIAPTVAEYSLSVFYPSLPAIEETGTRQGCVVLCKTKLNEEKLHCIKLLRAA